VVFDKARLISERNDYEDDLGKIKEKDDRGRRTSLPDWLMCREKPHSALSLGRSDTQRTSSTLPFLARSFLALHDF
jgi:hypothetical protein